jgi:hypothetical protein
MYELKEYLNSINHTKKNLMDDDVEYEKKYNSFIINKCYSGFVDTVLLANEMNYFWQADKKLQYDFYINIIRPKKRFSPWLKKQADSSLELVKQYYGYNDDKAKSALKILTREQLEFIKTRLNRGGKQ